MILILSLLLLHNTLGGMAMVRSSDNEYDRLKGEWAIEHATENDWIIVTENAGLAETLRYLSKAQVTLVRPFITPLIASAIIKGQTSNPLLTYGRDFENQSVGRILAETKLRGGKVIFFEAFFNPFPTQFNRQKPMHTNLKQLRLMATVVHSGELGKTYTIAF